MKTVEEFIAGLPADENVIVKRLRSLILDTDPRLQEKLSYGVPYFYHHRAICFLWPVSAIPKGMTSPKKQINWKVDFGFCYGSLLSNVQGLLLAENRKQVYIIHVSSLSNLDERALQEILQEAILVDDEFGRQKKKR